MGVLRWRSMLDAEIAHFSSLTLVKLDLEVLTALRMGTYQLVALDRIPPRAAVHESVELVKRARKRSAVPFANGLLRKISEHTDWGHQLRKAVEELHTAIKQDPGPKATIVVPPQDPSKYISYLAHRYAHPLWLLERWSAKYGFEATRKICRYDQSVPVTAIRIPNRSDEATLEKAGIILLNGELLTSAARVDCGDLTHTEPFRAGRVSIQDEASQLVALLVGTGSKILDCCAAPGGKTRAIAERNPNATVIAAELHPHRARLLKKLVPAPNVQVIAADVRSLPLNSQFDRVLADVPCSGTGTLARNPEIKWKLKPDDLCDLRERQLAILKSAMARVAPGGRLVYSTCSLEPEENEQVIEQALASHGSFQLVNCRVELERLKLEGELAWTDVDSLLSGLYLRTIPGVHPCDGFFAAILER